jgi:hypothetical protein
LEPQLGFAAFDQVQQRQTHYSVNGARNTEGVYTFTYIYNYQDKLQSNIIPEKIE